MILQIFFVVVVALSLSSFKGGQAYQPWRPIAHGMYSSSTRSSCIFSAVDGKYGDENEPNLSYSTTSANFAMDPTSDEAREILERHLGLTEDQCEKLTQLSALVGEWNDRINLVSRKDCTESVVFGRHVLPCLAPLAMTQDNSNGVVINNNNQRIVDVGTGGGFPGLPLAIAYPQSNFLLVDSVGKKLKAVQDMADQLGLTNLKTHHGRAEELGEGDKFDVCVGRSVAAIPKFCLWIQHLLKPKEGKLLYMIGGDIEEEILDETICSVDIDQLLNHEGASDKKILVFPQESVTRIARSTGVKLPRQGSTSKPKTSGKSSPPKQKKSKGQWSKKTEAPKQRGYDGFQRFESN